MAETAAPGMRRNLSLEFNQIEAMLNQSIQDLLKLSENAKADNLNQTNNLNIENKSSESCVEVNMSFGKSDGIEKLLKEEPKMKTKKDHIIDELINTEEDYINKLEYVCNNYEEWLTTNIGAYKTSRLFKNLGDILSESKSFLQELQTHKHEDCEVISSQFLKHNSLFKKYTAYCRNQQSAETAYQHSRDKIKEREIALDDKLGLHTSLLRPVQRLAKYEMLLKELQRTQDENEERPLLAEALTLIQDISQKSNNVVELEQLLSPKKFQEKLQRSHSFQIVHKV